MSKPQLKVKEIFESIPIADVMTAPVKVVNSSEDFSVVEEIFAEKGIRHLPVVDGQRKVIGLISQRDVYRRVAPRRAPDGKVVYRKDIIVDGDGFYEKESLDRYILNHVMHKNPHTLTKDKSLADAIHLIVSHKLGCVPIVDENQHPVGIITRFDILRISDGH